jgi:hypothetical protein
MGCRNKFGMTAEGMGQIIACIVDSPDYAALVDLSSPAAERGEKTQLK